MSSAGPLEIRTYTDENFGQNAYLVWCRGGERAAAIDPGGEPDAMAAAIEREGLTLDAVLLTHAHLDHISGVAELVRRTGAPVYLHRADTTLYNRVTEQAEAFGLSVDEPPPLDHPLENEGEFQLEDCRFEIRHVPGHAPGHVLFYSPEAGAAFIGDVVFQGSIGRTDLPGGNYRQLMRSIRERVLTLPDETELYPGHGPVTTVGQERVGNPFLTPDYGGGLA